MEYGGVAAGITGHIACLLSFWEGDNLHASTENGLETDESGVDRSAERRGDEELYGVVVRERRGEVAALLLAILGKTWV